MMLNKELAHEAFEYDESIRGLRWRKITSNRVKVGAEAGCITSGDGSRSLYKITSYKGRAYLVHRIVWLMHKGSLPLGEIDHIDGDGLNNCIWNLRVVTSEGNSKNMPRRRDNKSGVVGVSWHKRAKKWVVQSSRKGEVVYLGLYSDIQEAIAVRKDYEKANGYHENHGRP